MPLVCIVLTKSESNKQIFNETTLFDQSIFEEIQQSKSIGMIGQWHRCQRYGDVQSYSTAKPRCVKCAQGHFTHLCPKKKEDSKNLYQNVNIFKFLCYSVRPINREKWRNCHSDKKEY
nr:unnamed protein product [Callosobruchus analis]